MLKAIFLVPKADDTEALDRHVDFILELVRSSPGLVSVTTNTTPLMSPFGPPPYHRIVEATLKSLDDFIEIGRKAVAAGAEEEKPEGFNIVMYEFDQA